MENKEIEKLIDKTLVSINTVFEVKPIASELEGTYSVSEINIEGEIRLTPHVPVTYSWLLKYKNGNDLFCKVRGFRHTDWVAKVDSLPIYSSSLASKFGVYVILKDTGERILFPINQLEPI